VSRLLTAPGAATTANGATTLIRPARPDPQAGNAVLELVVLAPVVLVLLSLVIAAGRTSVASGSVQAAAREAARQASIARTPAAASTAAQRSADAELAAQHLHCRPAPVVAAHLQGFSVPPGLPASVSVTVSCDVPLADLVLPGSPGSRTLTATFSSPLDPFRGR
jgi:hypothetical protein